MYCEARGLNAAVEIPDSAECIIEEDGVEGCQPLAAVRMDAGIV